MRQRYCEYVLDKLLLWGPVVARAMFGGYGLYREGLMFAIIVSDTLYFKVDDLTRVFYEKAGSEPFSYTARGRLVRLSYWQVPAEVLENGEKLFVWSDQAYKVAQLARKKKR